MNYERWRQDFDDFLWERLGHRIGGLPLQLRIRLCISEDDIERLHSDGRSPSQGAVEIAEKMKV